MNPSASHKLKYKISVLVFLKHQDGRFLLMKRLKAPNLNCWSPIGGKLEMETGESPFECAIREIHEETTLTVTENDLHLFGIIAEKEYEGQGHWLMFLFDCHKPLDKLPPDIEEGNLAFYERQEIDGLGLPITDRSLLWPNYDQYKNGFIVIRANCNPDNELEIVVEQKAERLP